MNTFEVLWGYVSYSDPSVVVVVVVLVVKFSWSYLCGRERRVGAFSLKQAS